jgi:hypothetical protein
VITNQGGELQMGWRQIFARHRDERMWIVRPLVIMYEQGDGVVCRVYPGKRTNSHREYGILICDLVRDVANAFKVDEDNVWEWVHKERRNPTSPVTRLS